MNNFSANKFIIINKKCQTIDRVVQRDIEACINSEMLTIL